LISYMVRKISTDFSNHVGNQMAKSNVTGLIPVFFKKKTMYEQHLHLYYAASSIAYIFIRNTASSVAF